MKHSSNGRQGLLFTVTPVAATVLIVVAMAAVVMHGVHRTGPRAGAVLTTTPSGTPTTPVPTSSTGPDQPALASAAVRAVDQLRVDGVRYGVAVLDRVSGQEAVGSNLVLDETQAAQDYGADGFDQAFGLLESPRPATVKAKQGWMIDGSTMVLDTTGVLGSANRYVVAILTEQPAGIGYAAGRDHVNTATSLVRKLLAPAVD
jgi:hypothetical protein